MASQWMLVSVLVLGFWSQLGWAAPPLQVAICSQSPVKIKAVAKAFHRLFPDRDVNLVGANPPSEIAEQPVGLEWGRVGAQNRLRNARAILPDQLRGKTPDYWVSIENFISPEGPKSDPWYDQAVILVQNGDEPPVEELSRKIFFSPEFAIEAKRRPTPADRSESGFSTTVGMLISEQEGGAISADEWQGLPEFGGIPRKKILSEALVRAILKTAIQRLENFPKPGISFLDISPLLAQPELRDAVIDLFEDEFANRKIDLIAGLDARGFIFGSLLADRLRLPFVMVRKQGKLPRPTHSESYDTEYSSSTIEIAAHDVEGKTVLLVDDLLATGGTLRAAENLFLKAGARDACSACVIELVELKGAGQLKGPFFSILRY